MVRTEAVSVQVDTVLVRLEGRHVEVLVRSLPGQDGEWELPSARFLPGLVIAEALRRAVAPAVGVNVHSSPPASTLRTLDSSQDLRADITVQQLAFADVESDPPPSFRWATVTREFDEGLLHGQDLAVRAGRQRLVTTLWTSPDTIRGLLGDSELSTTNIVRVARALEVVDPSASNIRRRAMRSGLMRPVDGTSAQHGRGRPSLLWEWLPAQDAVTP